MYEMWVFASLQFFVRYLGTYGMFQGQIRAQKIELWKFFYLTKSFFNKRFYLFLNNNIKQLSGNLNLIKLE